METFSRIYDTLSSGNLLDISELVTLIRTALDSLVILGVIVILTKGAISPTNLPLDADHGIRPWAFSDLSYLEKAVVLVMVFLVSLHSLEFVLKYNLS